MNLLLHNLVVIEIISDLEELLHASLKYNNTVYAVFFLSCHERAERDTS